MISNHLGGDSLVGTSVQAGSIQALYLHPEVHLPPPTPRQLRPVPAHFTDRTADLKALVSGVVAQPRFAVKLLVIYGSAGVGKTTVANRLLHQMSAQFTGGQLYIDLRGHGLAGLAHTREALGRLVRSFRNGSMPVSADELAGWWRSITADLEHHVAILLDNARTAEQIRTLLPGGAGHLVVVTSRDWLPDLAQDGAVFHQLDPLDQTAAVSLLARCIGDKRVRQEQHAAEQIAAISGGLPLAMTVTAAQLAASPSRPLVDMIGHLSRNEHAPDQADHTYDHGKAAVTIALDPAYWELDRDAARVYRRLSILFTTDFDADLTAAALDIPEDAVRDALAALASAQLVEDRGQHAVRGRIYGFHDAVRAHARDRAQQEEPEGAAEETVRRALDWYLSTATRAERLLTPNHRVLPREYVFPPAFPVTFSGDEASALTWLDAQHLNLMAAVRCAFGARLFAMVWQLVHAMWPWWHLMQNYDLWFEAHRMALEAAGRCHDDLAEREILNTWGVGARGAHRLDDAIRMFSQVVDMARAAGDRRGESQALHELGSAHHAAGRATVAEPFLLQARELREAIGYLRGAALTDICLGLVALDTDRVREAVGHFTAARTVLTQEQDTFDAARALAWRGRAHARLADFPTAERLLRKAQGEFHNAGSPRWNARILEMLGETAREQNHPSEAHRFYTDALQAYEHVNRRDADRVRGRLRELAQ